MSSLVLNGDTSGSVTVTVPAVAGTNSVTLPAAAGTVMVSGNMPAFSAYMSANQSLSNATSTLMQFNTKFFDTGSCFNNTGSTVTLNGISVPAYSFAPNVSGYYMVTGNLAGPSSMVGNTASLLGKNVTSGYQYLGSVGNISGGIQAVGSTLVYLNGTSDYVYITGYQSTGGAALIYSGISGSIFSAYLVRTA